MEYYEALQTQALLAVLKPTRESWLRHVLRWYSKQFCTPLHVTQTLPLDDVLTAFYEERFEQMSDEDREDHLERLTETPEQRAQREAEEKKGDQVEDEFARALDEQVKQDMAKGKKAPALKRKKKEKLPGKLASFSVPSQTSRNDSKPPKPVTEPEPAPESVTELPLEPPPDISMDFGAGNLPDDGWLDGDIAPVRNPKRPPPAKR